MKKKTLVFEKSLEEYCKKTGCEQLKLYNFPPNSVTTITPNYKKTKR